MPLIPPCHRLSDIRFTESKVTSDPDPDPDPDSGSGSGSKSKWYGSETLLQSYPKTFVNLMCVSDYFISVH